MEFYKELIDIVKDTKIKEMLKLLLQEEVRHKNYFVDKLETLQLEKTDGFEEDSLFEYLDNNVFGKFDVMKKNVDVLDETALLQFGVLIEETTVNFYNALLENTSKEEGKKILSEIIEEEKKHEEMFRNLLNS